MSESIVQSDEGEIKPFSRNSASLAAFFFSFSKSFFCLYEKFENLKLKKSLNVNLISNLCRIQCLNELKFKHLRLIALKINLDIHQLKL